MGSLAIAFLLMVISWGESCGCISPETRVAVTHGDAQILDRQCATNTAVRRNTDDNSWDASSIAQAMLNQLFGDSTGDAIADRIREALEESPQGLSKYQIRRLFHGHVSCDRIDAALEQLMLIDAAGYHSEPTRGRSSTLWSATTQQQTEENEISEAGLDEFAAEEGGFQRL